MMPRSFAQSRCLPLALASLFCAHHAHADQHDAGWGAEEPGAARPAEEAPVEAPQNETPQDQARDEAPAEDPQNAATEETPATEPQREAPHIEAPQAEPQENAPVGPTHVDVPGPEPRITLVLDRPEGAQLMRENAIGWGTVCAAPCVARVPRDDSFVVQAPGQPDTDRLDLGDGPDRARLQLEPPSTGGLVVGSILTYTGVSILPFGLLTLAAGLLTENSGLTTLGGVTTGVAGVGLGVGVPLMLSNSHSDAELEPVARGRAWGLHASGQF